MSIKFKHILKNNTNNNNFLHSGDFGDLIYSIPVLEKLGGGNLFLSNELKNFSFDVKGNFNSSNILEFKKILNFNNIKSVNLYNPNIKNIIDLNNWRIEYAKWNNMELTAEEVDLLRNKNLVQVNFEAFNFKDYHKFSFFPWLKINPRDILSSYKKPIIINRTSRWNNEKFPWKKIVENFKQRILFLGLKDEYIDFINKFGKVDYLKTNSIYTLFQYIAGSKIFIGNQSFAFSLAEGLKKPSVQETDPFVKNCCFNRLNSLTNNNNVDNILTFINKFL